MGRSLLITALLAGRWTVSSPGTTMDCDQLICRSKYHSPVRGRPTPSGGSWLVTSQHLAWRRVQCVGLRPTAEVLRSTWLCAALPQASCSAFPDMGGSLLTSPFLELIWVSVSSLPVFCLTQGLAKKEVWEGVKKKKGIFTSLYIFTWKDDSSEGWVPVTHCNAPNVYFD